MTLPAVCVTVRRLGTSGEFERANGEELVGGSGRSWTTRENEEEELGAAVFWVPDLLIWMSRSMNGKVSGVS